MRRLFIVDPKKRWRLINSFCMPEQAHIESPGTFLFASNGSAILLTLAI